MANIDISSETDAVFSTSTHCEERLTSSGAGSAYQMKWSDIHPPGVVVLPKGSPPAGAGEINWEDTLGGKFAQSLKRLEGLMYAVSGARPLYDQAKQWYYRAHPRCLWLAEVWAEQPWTVLRPCSEYCDLSYGEYPALGDMPSGVSTSLPTLPIKSRSGDPEYKTIIGTHNRTYFPVGSVTRTDFIHHDPEGSGNFGSIYPGGALGDVNYLGQSVTFTYTKPNTAVTTGVELVYRVKPPGGSYGSSQAVTMTQAGNVFTKVLGPYAHGTEMQWYVRVNTGSGLLYDPGDSSAPSWSNAYYLQWFTHFNPYSNGFPELLDDYGNSGTVDIRHGTDFYQFDGSETIQPELINMARFMLSAIVGETCTRDAKNAGICGTNESSPIMHHNPRQRGNELCCIPMPIRWLWSGSNVYPHYKNGGKGPGALGTAPLHTGPNETDSGSSTARKTWRGINLIYKDSPFANYDYGDGTSWETVPGQFKCFSGPDGNDIYARYQLAGLQHNDVIDPVHIQEIIDAVDYLVNNGLWMEESICSRRKQPTGGQYLGIECGSQHSIASVSTGENSDWRTIVACDKCCDTAPGSCDGICTIVTIDGQQFSFGCEPEYFYCTPPSPPTFEDCSSNCVQERCQTLAIKSSGCTCETGTVTVTGYSRDISANCNAGNGWTNCGKTAITDMCGERDISQQDAPCVRNNTDRYNHSTYGKAGGWSAYICGPTQCRGGPDSLHGNGLTKVRYDHIDHTNDGTNSGIGCYFHLKNKNTGPSAGNCRGDVYQCGLVEGQNGDGLWFNEVASVDFDGIVGSSWLDFAGLCTPNCGCNNNALNRPPDVPGLGLYEEDTSPMCSFNLDAGISPDGFYCGNIGECICNANSTVCDGKAVWVAINLNLDGTNTPYANFQGRNGDQPSYSGTRIPRLKDYDLSQISNSSDCPCETQTGPGSC